MKKERIKILEMLENGKINADEAAKLLEALKGSGTYSWEDYDWDAEDKLNRFSQNVDSFAKEFGEKMESAYREVEPKLKKATKTVVEKTAAIIDEISKSLNEGLKKMEDEPCCGEPADCCDEQASCCDEQKDCCEEPPREN